LMHIINFFYYFVVLQIMKQVFVHNQMQNYKSDQFLNDYSNLNIEIDIFYSIKSEKVNKISLTLFYYKNM
jgi:hypothetical protein